VIVDGANVMAVDAFQRIPSAFPKGSQELAIVMKESHATPPSGVRVTGPPSDPSDSIPAAH